MARLNAKNSRFGIDNSDDLGSAIGVGSQFVSLGGTVISLTEYQFTTAFTGGTGAGWYGGNGFSGTGIPADPYLGTIKSISVDFLGGTTADYKIDKISIALSDIAATNYSFFIANIWNGSDQLYGSQYDDVLYGFVGQDVIYGRNGNDILNGGQGRDELRGGKGSDDLYGGSHGDHLYGGTGNDNLWGDGAADYLNGGGGIDNLHGGLGDDNMYGGTGGDFIWGEAGNDAIHGGRGADKLWGGAGRDVIYGGTGADDIYGGDNIDRLFGDQQNDNLYGGAGNDYLDGGSGQDYMAGGTGNDTYIVNHAGDEIVENADEGTDSVRSTVTLTLAANLENLTLQNSSGDIDGTGNELNNVIRGDDGGNILNGLGGNDRLFGGKGDDSLFGGDGNDYLDGGEAINLAGDLNTMAGEDGDDTYIVRAIGDQVLENLNMGSDTVRSYINYTLGSNVEGLRLIEGSTALYGGGNALGNFMVGNSNNNLLYGKDGEDRLFGQAGNDYMVGGNGNDIMTGGTGVDAFLFETGDGRDTIRDFEFGVEQLTFSGLTFGDLTFSSHLTGMLVEYGPGSDAVYLQDIGTVILTATDFDFV